MGEGNLDCVVLPLFIRLLLFFLYDTARARFKIVRAFHESACVVTTKTNKIYCIAVKNEIFGSYSVQLHLLLRPND